MVKLIFICTLISCIQFLNAGHYIGDYYISYPLKVTWWQASRFCTYYKQELIDIPDECEYSNIWNAISELQQQEPFADNIWTSGVRYNDDKWFYWENTGMPVIYADWIKDEPNMRNDENFLALWHQHGNKLGDQFSTEKNVFICRKLGVRWKTCDNNFNFKSVNGSF